MMEYRSRMINIALREHEKKRLKQAEDNGEDEKVIEKIKDNIAHYKKLLEDND